MEYPRRVRNSILKNIAFKYFITPLYIDTAVLGVPNFWVLPPDHTQLDWGIDFGVDYYTHHTV
jgi:hypothetical protein